MTMLTFAVALACAGCASIQTFHVAPRNVCLGNPVTVTWAASGDTVLSAEPPLPGTGPVPSSGSQQFTPSQSTRFTLTVRRALSSQTAEADVAVMPPAHEFGGLTSCSAVERALTISVSLAEPQVSSAMPVASVTNMNPRDIVLTKGDVRDTLAPGAASSAFAGQPAMGTWTLRVPLAPDETCAQALASVAYRLTFRLTFACGE